jgi:pilus assembly protein Flp/PilA
MKIAYANRGYKQVRVFNNNWTNPVQQKEESMSKYAKKQIKGATMIEYVLLVGLISLAAVTIMTTVGGSITTMFGKISTAILAS